MTRTHRRPPLPMIVAVALPVLLAVVVATIGIVVRTRGLDGAQSRPPETGPLAVAPVDAPAATGPECTALLSALPAELSTSDGPLPSRPIADPAPPAVRAWAAAPRPVVLRCGLPRPVELQPDSPLIQVDGVQWLEITDGLPQPEMITYVVVDRPVYVTLTAPTGIGTGPVQAVSDAVRTALPATPVAVR